MNPTPARATLPAWIDPTHQIRACFFCAYAHNIGNPQQMRCAAPNVTHARPSIPITEARTSLAVTDCGSEARHWKLAK